MRRHFVAILLALFSTLPIAAQTPVSSTSQTPQTARQALIEMFIGKGPDDLVKHLPGDAQRILIHKTDTPEMSWILRLSGMGRSLATQGGRLETFETGPNLLTAEDTNGHDKFEVAVEHDSLMGEDDEIELSVHYYKDGQLTPLPVIPRLTFTFQQEKEIWRLTEITAAAHVPLTDADYLKGLRKQQDDSNESMAQMRMGLLATSENTYSSHHPEAGFTCTIANLSTQAGDGEGVYDPGQGNADWNGYHFTITGCEGAPASKHRVTAVPSDSDSEMKIFCSDESGKVRFLSSGKPSSCFSQGLPITGNSQ